MISKPTYKELEKRVQELEQIVLEHEQTERGLKESEAKYRMVSDNSPAVLYQFLMSPNGTLSFLYVSDVVTSIFGVSAEEVINDASKLLGLVHPEDQEMFQASIKKSAETLETFPVTFRCINSGEVIWIEARGMPTLLTDGNILWSGFLLDITDSKKAEEQRDKLIVELKKMLSEVRILRGLVPICANCKQIRDDEGYWHKIEVYIESHSEAEFSHGICPDCKVKLYPDIFGDKK